MAGDLKICEEVALAANLQRPAEEHEWKLGRQRGPGAPYPPSRGRNKPPRNGTVTDDTRFITRYCCLESSVAARRACITSHQTLPLTSSRLWMRGSGSLCEFSTRRGNSPPSCGSVWIAKAAYWQAFCYGSEAASLCELGFRLRVFNRKNLSQNTVNSTTTKKSIFSMFLAVKCSINQALNDMWKIPSVKDYRM